MLSITRVYIYSLKININTRAEKEFITSTFSPLSKFYSFHFIEYFQYLVIFMHLMNIEIKKVFFGTSASLATVGT